MSEEAVTKVNKNTKLGRAAVLFAVVAGLALPAPAADWVTVPGTSREYIPAKVGVHRKAANSRDIDGDLIVDSIQIVFRDGSSLNLYCAQNRYTMWDTVAKKNWGGAVTDMPLAQTMSAQFCPKINQLPCKPTYTKGDPPCKN